MPTFRAVPAITSSTAFTGPPEEMIRSDIGSVFSAIRKIRPSAWMKIMSRERYVFFIHIETSCCGEKSKSMPRPSGSSLRNIRPFSRSSLVLASSTLKTLTPDRVTISRFCTSAARAALAPRPHQSPATSNAAVAHPALNLKIPNAIVASVSISRDSKSPGRRQPSRHHVDVDSRNRLPRIRIRNWIEGDLVGRQPARTNFGLNLRRHHALGAGPVAHQHVLARAQLGHSIPAQGFHVDEDVGSSLAAGHETKPAQAVEPHHLGALYPARWGHAAMGAP